MLLNLPPVAMCMYNGRYSVDFPDAHIAVPEAPSSHFFRRKKKKGGGAISQMPTWTSPTDPDRIDPMFIMDEGEEDTDDLYPPDDCHYRAPIHARRRPPTTTVSTC